MNNKLLEKYYEQVNISKEKFSSYTFHDNYEVNYTNPNGWQYGPKTTCITILICGCIALALGSYVQ